MGNGIRGIALALLAIIACGCSTGQIRPAIVAFSQTTLQAQASFSERQRSIDALLEERATAKALDAGPLGVRRDGCDLDADHCRLYVVTEGDVEVAVTPEADHVSRLMDALAAYAGDLSALASAETDPQLKAAAAETAKSIAGFGSTIDAVAAATGADLGGAGAAIGARAGPVGEIVAILGQRLNDRRRLAAIRRAVALMEAELDYATWVLGRADRLAGEAQAELAQRTFTDAYADYIGGPSKAKLMALRKAAVDFDVALSTSGSELFLKLREAHHEIAAELASPTVDFRDLWPLLESIAADAAGIARAAEQLQEIDS